MFVIDKDVAFDEQKKRVSWPWKGMEVGDSVFIGAELSGKAQASCHVYGHFCGKKFTTRKEGDGVRVWRIE